MRSGYVDFGGRIYWHAGYRQFAWSQTSTSKIWNDSGFGAHMFVSDLSRTYPSAGPDSRKIGTSLRCLSTAVGGRKTS